MERFRFEDVINMVYELLFLGFVKMFPQELGKCLISQRISLTLFIVEFTDSFRVFKVPHPWDRSLFAKHCKCRIWNPTSFFDPLIHTATSGWPGCALVQ